MIGQHERTQTGYRENLLPWQQEALFQLWTRFFRLCQTPAGTATDTPQTHSATSSTSVSHQPSREHLSHTISVPNLAAASNAPQPGLQPSPSFRGGGSSIGSTSAAAGAGRSGGPPSAIPKDDQVKLQMQGQQEAKEMRNFLAKYGGDRLRKVFWQMVKGEHPDAIMLRLLRARKWNIDRAVAVLGSTAAWRVENDVEGIMRGGELTLTSTRGGFNVMQNGVSYMYGATPAGEPVYIIEVGNHFSSSQTQDELQRAVILLQETLGSLMPPPVERKVVIFNMNNFGIRNMDWWCVFFMVKTMECFYVETLARVYVHGAPWIFKPIWTILKPLLDPVVRDKIRLTSDAKELEEYIPWDHLPKDSMKGGMDWEFKYPIPVPGENDLQKDTHTRDILQEDYFAICFDLERATKAVARSLAKASSRSRTTPSSHNRHSHAPPAAAWQQDAPDDDAASIVGGPEYDEPPELAGLKAHRDVLATKLRVAWLKLRPYVVGKTKMDRWKVVQDDGTLLWTYPKLDGSVEQTRLGEATSLPSLQRNLAAIERSAAGVLSDDGDDERDDDDDDDDDDEDAFDDAQPALLGESDSSADSNRKHNRSSLKRGVAGAAHPTFTNARSANADASGGGAVAPMASTATPLPHGADLAKTTSAGSLSVRTADSRLSSTTTPSLRAMNGNKKGERRRESNGSGSGSGANARLSPNTAHPSTSASASLSSPPSSSSSPQPLTTQRPTTSTSTISEGSSSAQSHPSTFHSVAGTARQSASHEGGGGNALGGGARGNGSRSSDTSAAAAAAGARGSYGSDLVTPPTSVEEGSVEGGGVRRVGSVVVGDDDEAAAAAQKEVPVHPLARPAVAEAEAAE